MSAAPAHRRASGDDYPPEAFAGRRLRVALVVPAVDEADTIAATVGAGIRARAAGVLDDIVVIDGGSADATAARAADAGARVVVAADVLAEFGPVLGKGDAMWRSLAVVATDVVVFLDADIDGDLDAFIRGLVGPLTAAGADPATSFVKGSFHRIAPDGVPESDPFDGGRVTELMARPLLNLFRPDLAAYYQPLGGQVAGRVDSLRSLPVLTGYAVEIGMLVDAVDRLGAPAVVEVALGAIRNRPRPTSDLAPMAQQVLAGFLSRVLPSEAAPLWVDYVRPRIDGGTDRFAGTVVERPPMAEVLRARG